MNRGEDERQGLLIDQGIETLLARLAEGLLFAPMAGFAVGVLLSLSPLALPSAAAAVAAFSPGRLQPTGERERVPMYRTLPTLFAFVLGTDGVLAFAAGAFVQVTVLLVRSSVVLYLGAAVLLGTVGLLLLTRRVSLCSRARTIPPRPAPAFAAGVVFGFTGCPGCAPIVVGIASVAALTAGPATTLAVIVAFLVGRTLTLAVAAELGSRLLPTGTSALRWARLDLLAGAMFVLAASFYLWQVLSGQVTTALPGEPGGRLPGG